MKENKEVNTRSDNVIYAYTRQQAIDDGVLIDISDLPMTKEAGYKIPVVLTKGVYSLVLVPKGLEGEQDFNGRLWDVLYMSVIAIKSCKQRHPGNAEEKCGLVPFKVIFQMSTEEEIKETKGLKYETVKLWLVFNAHEGFTIMKPEEY